jgi:hypothetical protein
MRIYTIERVEKPKVNFERVYHIRFNERSIPRDGDLDTYLRRNFADNYCLIAHYSQIIAGCSTNNAIYCPDRPIQIEYYEMGCSERDAENFLRVWEIPEEEYQHNLDYLTDLRHRQAGWTKVDGEFIPTHKLIAVWKAVGGYQAHESL